MAAAGAEGVLTLLNSPAGRFSFAGSAAEGGGAAGQASQQRFEAYLAEVAATGAVPLQMPLFSAHQMGTCRLGAPRTARWEAAPAGAVVRLSHALISHPAASQPCAALNTTPPWPPRHPSPGADPDSSVLDPGGQCWEVAGLYAADGSTFPTPTGVNPMIS